MVTQSRSSKVYKPALLSLAIAITAVAANTSLAGSIGDFPSVTVKYADLDLGTDVGVRRLYKRISAAAEQVCPAGGRDLQFIASSRKCRAEAIERAVQSLHNSQLAAVHAEHMHQG